MRILLIGEYNNSHNFLKSGLEKLGHEVVVIGLNDGFKNISVDLKIRQNYTTGLKKKIKILLHKVFNIDLHSISVYNQIKKQKSLLSNFDIVKLIN